jgi:3',5'-cyclic AMP phosphodiesterase CpdA
VGARAMRTPAHISDLHFGRLDARTLSGLRDAIIARGPDIIVVSGDLTQRARNAQFAAARRFLDSLPAPRIVVPGNHDVPLYNVLARSLWPLAAYRRHIAADLEPFYCDDEIALLGVNTARSLTFKDGRINRGQVERGCARLDSCGSSVIRIVVTHHPFDVPGGEGGVVGRASMAMEGFAQCRVDMILSGHLHLSHIGPTPVRYGEVGHIALLVQAGTATSSRRRAELNSFNLLHINRPLITVDRLFWDDQRRGFVVINTDRFQLTPAGWSRLSTGS